jgi:glyoxylase-like metal-dependent hydrolase (beta-lactamase superfamily II)
MHTWPFGPYPVGGLVPLGPHVTGFHAEDFPLSNSAIVRGTDATLVFDPNCLGSARSLHAAVAAGGPAAHEVVFSHAHDDHWMGAELFAPPATVHARPEVRDRLQRTLDQGRIPGAQYERRRPGAEAEGRGVRVVLPDVLVRSEASVDLGGGVVVRLYPAPPAHTDGDLWALVEPDGVALCGDLWFVNCEPFVGSGSVRGLLDAIAWIRQAGAAIHLPGHGPAARLGRAGTDPAERYLAWVLEATADAVGRGLGGRELGTDVRGRFEDQRSRPGGVDVGLSLPGFLETTAAAAERDLRPGP